MESETKQKVLNMNIQAVQSALKLMNTKVDEQAIRIDGLVSTIATMQNDLNSMNQRLAIQQAKQFGTGATA